MSSFQSIFENALKLKPLERTQLVEGLLNSLEKPDEEIDRAWKQEALKRYEAYKENRVRVKDLDEVMKRYL